MTAALHRLRINLLGPFEIRGAPPSSEGSRPLTPLRIALFAHLALAPDPERRDALHGLFFANLEEQSAWHELNQAVFSLRAAFGDEAIVSDAETLSVDRDRIDCDAVDFEAHLRRGELAGAMTLYRGEFLGNVPPTGSKEVDEWVNITRSRMRAKAATACTSLSMDLADRDARASLDWSRRAYEIEPSESSLRRLMVLHDALGDAGGAIRAYERFARTLRADRGIEPSTETQRLLAEIREGQRATPPTGEVIPPQPSSAPPSSKGRYNTMLGGMLTVAIVIAIGITMSLANRTPADGATATGSRAALEAYRQGEADMHAGRFQSAVEHFKHAVSFDSTYAMAFYKLSEAANWTGESGLAGDAAANAERLAATLPTPDRARIDAWSLYLRGMADQAGKLYSGMLAADSADADAWFYLAEIQFHWGPMFGTPTVRSAPAWDRVLTLDPNNAGALIHRLRIAAMEFDRAKFDSLSARLDKLTPSPDRAIEVRGIRAYSFGDSAAQRGIAREVSALDLLKKSLVREMLISARDPRSAGRLLVPTLFTHQGFASWEQGDLLLSAQTEAETGDVSRALAVIDSAALLQPDRALEYRAMLASMEDLPMPVDTRRDIRRQLDSKPSPQNPYATAMPLRHYLAATLDVRLGDLASAKRNLVELRDLATKANAPIDSTLVRHITRLARIVSAEIARAEHNPAEAVRALGEPTLEPDNRIPYVWSYPRAHERFLRGQLAAELGHVQEAQSWFETFPDPGAYDLAYVPWALRRRADLAEKSGDAKDAHALRDRADRLFGLGVASQRH